MKVDLNKRIFAKDRFGINESVSFSFVDKSEINGFSIIQNTELYDPDTASHFVNLVSINGNIIKIRDTFNGRIRSLDLNGTGFITDRSWNHSFTNMNFYYPGGN